MIENLFDSKENLQIKVKNLEEVKELQEAYITQLKGIRGRQRNLVAFENLG